MHLIDTDVLIWALRGNEKYLRLLQSLKDKGPLSVSVITIAEIYKNIYPSEIIKTENVFNEMEALEINSVIAKQAGLYWQEYVKQHKNLSLTDCLIASTAVFHNLRLVSLNTKHFPMSDIQLLSPEELITHKN